MTNKEQPIKDGNIIRRTIDKLFPTEKRGISIDPTTSVGLPYGFAASPLSVHTALQLSAVYRCVEVVSDAIASQTWDITEYDEMEGFINNPFHKNNYMLNFEPNSTMSRYTMMKTLVAKVLLEGNGYLIIRRDSRGDPVKLDLVNGSVLMFKRKNGSIYYQVQYTGYDISTAQHQGQTEETIDSADMIHILNFSYDGLQGISTLRHASNTMGVSYASEASAKGFFLSGANVSGILTTDPIEGKLTKEKADALKSAWSQTFSPTAGTPGGIAVMEGGLKFTPVTVNPKAAQLLETRQFNVIEICRFFGVHPSKVFDSANLTYSNIESFQLGFITDTVSPFNAKIEAEFNRKLFRPSQRNKTRVHLNVTELLRADMDSTANYYAKMYMVGAYSPNEIRVKIGQPKIDGGDKSYTPMNLIPVDAPITQNKKVDKQISIETTPNGTEDTNNKVNTQDNENIIPEPR